MTLTPEEAAELAALEQDFGHLTMEEAAELAALEAEFGDQLPSQPQRILGAGMPTSDVADKPVTMQEGLTQLGKGVLSSYAGMGELLPYLFQAPGHAQRTTQDFLHGLFSDGPTPPSPQEVMSLILKKGAETVTTDPIQESRESGVLAPVRPKGESAELDALKRLGEWTAPLGRPGWMDLAMGGGAVVGGAIGDVLDKESGEAIGGMLPLLWNLRKSPAAIREYVGDLSQNDFKNLMSFMRNVVESGKTGDAKENALFNMVTSIKQALGKGDVGTSADLSRSTGLAQLEQAVPQYSDTAQKIENLTDARTEQTLERARKAYGAEGTVADALDVASKRYREKPAQLKQALEQVAEKKRQPVIQEAAETRRRLEDQRDARVEVLRRVGEEEQALVTSRMDEALKRQEAEAQADLAASQQREIEASQQMTEPLDELEYRREMAEPETEGLPSVSSKEMMEERAELAKTSQAQVKEAYEGAKSGAVPKELDRWPALLRQGLREQGFSDRLIKDTLEGDLEKLADVSSLTPRGDLIDLDANLRKQVRELKRKPDAGKELAILSAASDMFGKALSDNLGSRYRMARRKAAARQEQLGGSVVQTILRRNKDTPENAAKELFVTGPKGAAYAKNLLKAGEKQKFLKGKSDLSLQTMEDYIFKLANKAADQNKLPEFLANHEEFLTVWGAQRKDVPERLEALRTAQERVAGETERFQQTVAGEEAFRKEREEQLVKTQKETRKTALDEAKAVTKKTADAEKALRDETDTIVNMSTKARNNALKDITARAETRKSKVTSLAAASPLKKFIDAPRKTVAATLKRERPTQFKAIYNAFKTPKEKAHFYNVVGDVISDTIKKGNVDDLEILQSRLKNAIPAADQDKMADVVARVQFARFKKTLKKARDAEVEIQGGDSNLMNDFGVSFGTAVAMKISNLNSLILAGSVRRALKRVLGGMSRKEYLARFDTLLDRMITEPDVLLELMEKGKFINPNTNRPYTFVGKPIKRLERWLENLMTRPTLKGAVIAGQEDE